MTENPQENQTTWPTGQRDYTPEALVCQQIRYQMHIKEPDGRWMLFGAAKESRDEMTLVQADRARRFPEEKRRIAQEITKTVIDEVEGDGDGETSREELFARNEEITQRLLEQEKNSSSGQ